MIYGSCNNDKSKNIKDIENNIKDIENIIDSLDL